MSKPFRGDLYRGRPGCCRQDDIHWLVWMGGKVGLRRRRRRRENRAWRKDATA